MKKIVALILSLMLVAGLFAVANAEASKGIIYITRGVP